MYISKETKSEKYGWFINKLSNDFRLNLNDKSKVIFGYNGIGKTTLSKIICEKYSNEVHVLSYEDDIFKKDWNENKIQIKLNINEIMSLKDKVEFLKKELDLKKKLKEIQINNPTDRKKVGLNKNNLIKLLSDKKEIQNFFQNHNTVNKNRLIIIAKNYDDLIQISDKTKELEKLNNSLMFDVLTNVKNLFIDSTVCPICNSSVDWKKIINDKLDVLNDCKNSLLKKYKESNVEFNLEYVNEDVEIATIFHSNPNLKNDILLTHDVDGYNRISEYIEQYNDFSSKLDVLTSRARVYFNNLQNEEARIKRTLNTYYGLHSEDIVFDTENNTITIVFPRNIETYSTGELNLIKFIFKLYSFIGSDKKILLLDDPASSFDVIHQYIIAFEIIKHSKLSSPNKVDKHLIVFTHNVDMINILNNQNPTALNYYYLEKYEDKLYIDEILCNDKHNNLISIDKLEVFDNEGLIKHLKVRDNLGDEQSFFHYSKEPKIIHDISIDNHKLISLIDELSLEHKDFYSNSYIKVISLCVLRIWLEKKMYETIPENDEGTKKDFLKATTIGTKICIFSNKCNASIREKLMSKKVMLNQGVHYDSLVAPFSFAMNLSLDDLKNEVNSIKEIFNNINNK